ncbi:MAG: hypothetical protein AB1728_08420 [Bacteroidota bacterium]
MVILSAAKNLPAALGTIQLPTFKPDSSLRPEKNTRLRKRSDGQVGTSFRITHTCIFEIGSIY